MCETEACKNIMLLLILITINEYILRTNEKKMSDLGNYKKINLTDVWLSLMACLVKIVTLFSSG